jgi:hypothetical protein
LYDNKEKKYKGKFVIKKAKNKKGKEMRRECRERAGGEWEAEFLPAG